MDDLIKALQGLKDELVATSEQLEKTNAAITDAMLSIKSENNIDF